MVDEGVRRDPENREMVERMRLWTRVGHDGVVQARPMLRINDVL